MGRCFMVMMMLMMMEMMVEEFDISDNLDCFYRTRIEPVHAPAPRSFEPRC